MHNGTIMNAHILLQLLEKLALAEYKKETYVKLSTDERLLLYCYRKLDARDKQDILCFLSEKISH